SVKGGSEKHTGNKVALLEETGQVGEAQQLGGVGGLALSLEDSRETLFQIEKLFTGLQLLGDAFVEGMVGREQLKGTLDALQCIGELPQSEEGFSQTAVGQGDVGVEANGLAVSGCCLLQFTLII